MDTVYKQGNKLVTVVVITDVHCLKGTGQYNEVELLRAVTIVGCREYSTTGVLLV